MNLRKHLFLGLLGLSLVGMLSGCASIKTDYIGEKYPATDSVEYFYDKTTITRPYRVMGTAVARADDTRGDNLANAMQEKVVADAKNWGADAVLFKDVKRTVAGRSRHGGTTFYDLILEGELLKYE